MINPSSRSDSERPASVTQARVLARPDVRLLLVSATLLFTELLLIRWIPANVIYVGFFRNFLLMASFLGIGLGILWGRRTGAVTLPLFGPLLLAVAILVLTGRVSIQLAVAGRDLLRPVRERERGRRQLPRAARARRRWRRCSWPALRCRSGGLLKSMPPLAAYRGTSRGSTGRASPGSRCCRRWGRRRSCGSACSRCCSCSAGSAAGLRRASLITGGHRRRDDRCVVALSMQPGPVLVARTTGSTCTRPVRIDGHRRERHPAPGDAGHVDRALGSSHVRAGLRLVPGPDLRQRPDRRGRLRHRRRGRAGEGRERTSTRSRSIRSIQQIGARAAPEPAVRRPSRDRDQR